jgi:preprotein translocase subunit SecF
VIELVAHGTHIDFIGRWKIAAMLSALVIAAGLAAAPSRLQVGIDFAGGWEIQVRFDESVKTDEGAIRSALSAEVEDVSVVRFGNDEEFLVRFAVQPGEDISASLGGPSVGEATPELLAEGREPAAPVGGAEAQEREAEAPSEVEEEARQGAGDEELATLSSGEVEAAASAGVLRDGAALRQGQRADRIRELLNRDVGSVSLERVEFVGPRVGAELRRAGVLSLLIAGAMILVYISFRFTFRFAPGAIVALLHDVLVTSSLWVLMGREFNLQVLAALLAIVGYSLNDTIIVYDRIRENMELRTTTDLPEVLNRSINQTLSRTVLTSLTTLLAVFSLLLLGGEVIRPFASAMAIGIVIGTYSSVFVAAPVLLWLERRYGGTAAPATS